MRRIKILDSHTGGEPTRLVLEGLEEDELSTYRRAVLVEPRGHEVIVGALMVPVTEPGCVANIVFFNNVGLLGMCGHGMIGVIRSLQHLGKIGVGIHQVQTPVGKVSALLHKDGKVSIQNVSSRRITKNLPLGAWSGDIAWGGNYFLLVNEPGIPLQRSHIHELTALCLDLKQKAHAAGYPEVDHVELFSTAHFPNNHSRNFVLCPGGEYDRSPCGTGTSAKLACLAEDGKLAPGEVWRQESILGTVFEASYEQGTDGIIPTITGQAFITAETTLLFDPSDPFERGLV